MDRNKYDFLNSLLDKEIEMAKNRSLSFTDSRNSFLTNVHKSSQQNSSIQTNQKLLQATGNNINQQNEINDNSTTSNSYGQNLNSSNNKSLNDTSYDNFKNYQDQKCLSENQMQISSHYKENVMMNGNIIQDGRKQNENILIQQNNIYERDQKHKINYKSNDHKNEFLQQGKINNLNRSSCDQRIDNSFTYHNSNVKNQEKTIQDNLEQSYYDAESSSKNNFENSITNYPKDSRNNALQTSINQSSGFSPFDNIKHQINAQYSPERVNSYLQNSNEMKTNQVSNPLAIQAHNQLEEMRRQISQNSLSPHQRTSVSLSQNNTSYNSKQIQYQQQSHKKSFKQKDSFQLSQYESTQNNSQERKNLFQREFESIQNKISALELKLKKTEERNQELGVVGLQSEQQSFVSQAASSMGIKNGNNNNNNTAHQNKKQTDLSIFTNPTIKQNHINSSQSNHFYNQVSPRFNAQDSQFTYHQEIFNKNQQPQDYYNEQDEYMIKQNSNLKQKSSSGKKKKNKYSSKKSDYSENDSGMKPKNFNTSEILENNSQYISKVLEEQILNDSKGLKIYIDSSKSRQIRFKTPNSKRNSSLPNSSSYNDKQINHQSTLHICSKQNNQHQNSNNKPTKEENNMYAEELKALQKEYQMWEQRKEKQHLQLLNMQDNNKRNISKLKKSKKEVNKLVKLKKEQEVHITEYDQLYNNFEKCELIRQKQKILISCLKDELKLLYKRANSKQNN